MNLIQPSVKCIIELILFNHMQVFLEIKLNNSLIMNIGVISIFAIERKLNKTSVESSLQIFVPKSFF